MNYKCKNCGGELEYKPDIKKLACSSCFSTFNVEELQMNSLKGIEQCFCESCGAQLVFAEGESIAQCSYCLSNQVKS